MDFTNYIIGFYTALSFSCGVFFLMSRKRRAPFREAFGWMSMYCAGYSLLYFIMSNSEFNDPITKETLIACSDITTIPFIAFVITTIVNQDIKKTPFSTRWMHIAIQEIPVIICMGICVFTQYEWRKLMVIVLLILYMVGVISYSTFKLVKYEKHLSNHEKGKEASIKWMWYLVGLLLTEAMLYFAVGSYITNIIYYFVVCTATCIATYFINKQSPIDTRQLFSAAITKDYEESEKQPDETETSFLTRKDMEVKVKQFMAENPQFGKQIAERAVQKLTVRDMYLCIMIIQGNHVNEIAGTLAISKTSVDVARYRLRVKLNLNKGENLSKVLKACL